MQKVLGFMRKAIMDYEMIENGDKIAVGVSGGKDSVVTLVGLSHLRNFLGKDFDIVAITIDPCFGNKETDYTSVTKLCEELNVKHIIRRSELGKIIFEIRKEKNPCSLCARMRRGMLHDITLENGCNKLALGHHAEDAVETFIMNLFHEGRVGCFQPVTYLSRKDLTMFRPLIYTPEQEVIRAARRNKFPIVKSECLVDGVTSRAKTREWLKHMEKNGYPGITKRMYGAIKRGHISGW